MRFLVIGGNGFIGSPLVRELRSCGHEVAVFSRSAYADPVDGALSIRGDRNRIFEYLDQLRRFAPDVVVDLILSSGAQASQLMETMRQVTRRVVAISSMDVYRAWGIVHGSEHGPLEPLPLEPLPLTENSPLRTVRKLYPPETLKMMQSVFTWVNEDYDKIAVEEAVMNDAVVSGTVLRLPMVYGPGDPLHRFFPLVKRVADGRLSMLLAADLAEWRGPRGYVENVAHAIAVAAAADRAAGRIYNICDEPTLSELEWQTRIATQMHWPGSFVVLPREETPQHLLQPGNAAQHVVATSERIRTELGYAEVVGVGEAIERTAAWEQQNPPAKFNTDQFDYEAEDAALAGVS